MSVLCAHRLQDERDRRTTLACIAADILPLANHTSFQRTFPSSFGMSGCAWRDRQSQHVPVLHATAIIVDVLSWVACLDHAARCGR